MKNLFFLFFLLISFNAFSSGYRITNTHSWDSPCSSVSVGDIVPSDFCVGSEAPANRGVVTSIGLHNGQLIGACGYNGSCMTIARGAVAVPTCSPDTIYNPLTNQCDNDDFCSSSEWLEVSASEGNACAALYPNHLTDFSALCKNRNDYSFTCNQGIEKPPVTDPDPTDPDPTDPDPTVPDNPDPDYGNSGNATGSGSSGGSASASDGNVSVDISFDGVHNRLDAVNENLAGTNERIETTNQLFNDFSNRYNKNSQKSIDAIDGLNSDLGKKLDANGKQIADSITGLGDKLDDLSDGSNTSANDFGCGLSDFSCDGNSYECYIARTNWKNRCLMETLTGDPLVPREGVPIESSQQVFESGDALINDLKGYSSTHLDPDKLSNGDVLITDSLDKFNESNGLSFDEKCPAPNVVDTGMGVFTIDYTPFCDLALYVRAMLMLFASIGSILMISKFS